jgi:hypothetical protein
MCGLIFLLSRTRMTPPKPLTLSFCQAEAPGKQRISSQFGIQFDVDQSEFVIKKVPRDMPPGTLYLVTPVHDGAGLVIWYDDMFDEFRLALPTLSEHVQEREIFTAHGTHVGHDRWGYLSTGDRWRLVTFLSGDAAGYRPVDTKKASVMDQVINSACVLPNGHSASTK